MNVDLFDFLSLDVRESFDDIVELINLDHERVITVEDQTILDGHDLISCETTRVVVSMAVIVTPEVAVAGLGFYVLLDSCALNKYLHVSHDDSFTVVLTRSNKLLKL
jgi:hypothetical protein